MRRNQEFGPTSVKHLLVRDYYFVYTRRVNYSIGQLSKQTRESVKTLRFWTEQKLLDTTRGSNGYRYYQADMVKRVSFIRSAQAIGFTLAEIRSILELRAEGVKPCAEVRQELQNHLTKVQEGMAELKQLESELSARLNWAAQHPDPDCESDGCVYLGSELTSN